MFLDDHVADGTKMTENIAEHTFINTCFGIFRLKAKIHLYMQWFLHSAWRFSILRLTSVALNSHADLPAQKNLAVNNAHHVLGTAIVFQVRNGQKSVVQCHALTRTSHNRTLHSAVVGKQLR